ncbi:MAG: hypothetical protein R3268_05120 [Acidiferrobacterales bacterium]|nr:hypothetical protein [Acidiferrobacterales bacterium]
MMRAAKIAAPLAGHVKALIEAVEDLREADPAIGEAAEMVYIGDVYALRELIHSTDDPSWGKRPYGGDLGDDPL